MSVFMGYLRCVSKQGLYKWEVYVRIHRLLIAKALAAMVSFFTALQWLGISLAYYALFCHAIARVNFSSIISHHQRVAPELPDDDRAYPFRSTSRHYFAYSHYFHYSRRPCNRTTNHPLQCQKDLASEGVVVTVPWVASLFSLAAAAAWCQCKRRCNFAPTYDSSTSKVGMACEVVGRQSSPALLPWARSRDCQAMADMPLQTSHVCRLEHV